MSSMTGISSKINLRLVRRRWAGFGVALVVLGVGASVCAEKEAASERQLVKDAHSLLSTPMPRPPHTDVILPGDFGSNADLAFRRVAQCGAVEEKDSDELLRKAVLAGTRPLSDLPAVWVEAERRCGSSVSEILRATHSADGRLSMELGPLGMLWERPLPYAASTAEFAGVIAAVQAIQAEGRGSIEAGIDICLDGLALGRDISGGGTPGRIYGGRIVAAVAPACMVLLKRATPEQLGRFRSGLHHIEEGWPPIRVWVEQEKVASELKLFYSSLSDKTKDALPIEGRPPSGAEVAEQGLDLFQRIRWFLFRSAARREWVRIHVALEAVVDLRPPDSDQRVAKIASDMPVSLQLARDGLQVDWRWRIADARVAPARLAILDAVSAVREFRARLGTWPTSWAQLNETPILDPRNDRPINLVAEAHGFRVSPPGDASVLEGDRLRVELQ